MLALKARGVVSLKALLRAAKISRPSNAVVFLGRTNGEVSEPGDEG